MSNHPLTVADDLVVGLEYTLRLDDGEVIDASEDDGPLEYLHGHSNIIPGLEKALSGLKIGDARKISVDPADAYGEYDEEALELIPYDAFPEDLELEPGMDMQLRDAQTGQIVEAYVADLLDEGVLLDLNHPLAGEVLHFDVKVISLRTATADELAHGHVHGAGHAH